MSTLLDMAVADAKRLPEEEQDALAAMIVEFMRPQSGSLLTPEQEAEVVRRMADPSPVLIDADEALERIISRLEARTRSAAE